MEMSRSALPPQQPPISEQDRSHPLFPIYHQHRSACQRLLVQADTFSNWLYQYERNLDRCNAASDPRYSSFLEWMRTNQGGSRTCPAGQFPHNFYYWIEGGRW